MPLTQQITANVALFYDAPSPVGVFDDFLAIQPAQGNVSTLSYFDHVIGAHSLTASPPTRLVYVTLWVEWRLTRYLTLSVFYEGVPVTQYSPAVFDAFMNHTRVSPVHQAFTVCRSSNVDGPSQFWGKRISALDSTAIVKSGLEPFDSGLFSHGSPSAYPPDRSRAVFPSALVITWSNASLDKTMADLLRDGAKTIRGVAIADGQNLSHAAVYVNYALFDTPLEDMYGGNLARLRRIKAKIDPERVMDLSGGFKF